MFEKKQVFGSDSFRKKNLLKLKFDPVLWQPAMILIKRVTNGVGAPYPSMSGSFTPIILLKLKFEPMPAMILIKRVS